MHSACLGHGSVQAIPSTLTMCTGVLVIPQTQKTSENHGEAMRCPPPWGASKERGGDPGITANTSVLPFMWTWKPRMSLDCSHSSEKGRLCSFTHSEFSLKADTTHPSSPPGLCPPGAHKGVKSNQSAKDRNKPLFRVKWRTQARDWYWRPHVAGSGTALGRAQTLVQRDSLLGSWVLN